MDERLKEIFDDAAKVIQRSREDNGGRILEVADLLTAVLRAGNKVLIFGNGGSAADSQHLAAELIGKFQKERQALPAIALTTDTSTITALSNDYGFEIIFSRQIEALGQAGDVALGFSTSGNSQNVVKAVETAKVKGMRTVVLTGQGGGKLAAIADICLAVPSSVTARVQEAHITIVHAICELVESKF